MGGLDYAFTLAGFEIRHSVEIVKANRDMIRVHQPKAQQHEDIRDVGSHNLSSTDAVVGGPPCQPASKAGKRGGTSDERWLWDEAIRVVREIHPKIAIFENVPGLRTLNNGEQFRGIVGSFAGMGYGVEWFTLSASEVGAPQKRKRLFIVAYDDSGRRREDRISRMGKALAARRNASHLSPEIENSSFERGASEWSPPSGTPKFKPFLGAAFARLSSELFRWPARPGVPQHEWEPPRLITKGDRSEVEQLKALGNAVPPRLAQPIAWATHEFLCHHYGMVA
jgi:DNA-cytosine methyltransferase